MAVTPLARRVHDAVTAAGVAIAGVSIGDPATKATWLVSPPNLQTAAQPTIDAFDTGQAAQDAYENTQAQVGAKALFDLVRDSYGKVLRAIASVLLDEVNILRAQIIGVATTTWDPANIANGAGLTSPTITVPGAAFGDFVDVAAGITVAGLTATGFVSAANTVNIRLHNGTGGAVNLASATWTVCVRRHSNLPARTEAQARTAIRNRIDAD